MISLESNALEEKTVEFEKVELSEKQCKLDVDGGILYSENDLLSVCKMEHKGSTESKAKGLLKIVNTPEVIHYTRASEPLLRQTIGRKRENQQSFNKLMEQNQELRNRASEYNISKIGANLSVSARYAMHAVQTLFTHVDYKEGNARNSLRITIPQYLDVYGVAKKDLGRGKQEYSPKARKDAISALYELTKPILWYYKELDRVNSVKAKEKRYNMCKGIDPILRIVEIYHELTETEAKDIEDGGTVNKKLAYLEIIPSSIFASRDFFLMPEHIFRVIRQRYRKPSIHFVTFITLLCVEAQYNSKVVRYYSTLTDNLNLKYLEDTGQKKRLETSLEKNFEQAKEIGLLQRYEVEQDLKGKKVTLFLNPAAFYQGKRIA